MSQRIDEILDVVREVESKVHAPVPFRELKKIRRYAVVRVAVNRGIDSSSIDTKYRRELYPDVRNTDDFDLLLEAWLRDRNRRLPIVLLKFAVDYRDEINIQQYFS